MGVDPQESSKSWREVSSGGGSVGKACMADSGLGVGDSRHPALLLDTQGLQSSQHLAGRTYGPLRPNAPGCSLMSGLKLALWLGVGGGQQRDSCGTRPCLGTGAVRVPGHRMDHSDVGVHCSSKNWIIFLTGLWEQDSRGAGAGRALLFSPGHSLTTVSFLGDGVQALNSWGSQGLDQDSSPSPLTSPSLLGLLLPSYGCHGNHRWLKFA